MKDIADTLRSLTVLVLTGIAVGACADAADDAAPAMEVTRDTIGDTVFVHTHAGQAWPSDARLVPEVQIGVLDGPDEYIFGRIGSLAAGPNGEIFAFDQQATALRKYDAQGNYVATFGREGEGPGEYKRPDGGMVVVDGRLVIRDPANARLTVYGLEGEHIGNWRMNGSLSTSSQMSWDRNGNVYSRALKNTGVPVDEWEWVLVRYDSTGQVRDSLDIPEADMTDGQLIARNENSSSGSRVPFFPDQYARLSPLGYWVHGVASRYGIKVYRDGEPDLVMGRTYDPIPVPGDYAAQRRRAINERFSDIQPGWNWNGPDIPDQMPPFNGLYVGTDGKIWVSLYQPYTEEENPEFDPSEEGSEPTVWRTKTVYDVFEPDGTYLGQVPVPDEVSTYPQPVFGPNWILAVTRDDLGVERVVRYGIRLGSDESASPTQ